MLITRDLNGRVRINGQSSRRNFSRLATRSGQSNNSSINELLCIVVNSHRAVIDGLSGSTRDEDTVSVPSVNRSAERSIVRSNIGSNLNLSALTSNIGGEGDIVDNRISMYSHIERSAGSSTTRGQLINLEGVAVVTNGRNNRVGQRGSTLDERTVVIPLINELVSIPIVEVGSQSDLTTNTNVVLSNADVHNRISVDINCSRSRNVATIFVHSRNAEVVSVVSVRTSQFQSIIGAAGSDDSIVLIPSVGVRSSRSRIHMSDQHDVVLSSNTNDRIGFDSQGRVRVDGDSHRSSEYHRTTTSSRLNHGSGVVVNGNITVNSDRRIRIGSTRSAFDDLTIAIPSVDLTTSNTTGNVSGQRELSTFAKYIAIGKVSSDGINLRIFIYSNSKRSAGSSTTRGQLVNLEGVAVVTIGRNNRVGQRGSTRNIGTIVGPLINQLISIPIIEVSSQSDLTTATNIVLSNVDVHNRIIIHINHGGSGCMTTIFIHRRNAEVVRIISVRTSDFQSVIVAAGSDDSVILIPCIGKGGSRSRIEMSNHNDVVLRSDTNDRIGFDSQSGIRVDGDGNRSVEHFRLTTGSGLGNRHGVVVNSDIAVNSNRRICISSTSSTRDDLAIAIPSVNLTTSNTAGDVSGQSELSTFADSVTLCKVSCDRIHNRNVVHHDRDSIISSTNRVLIGVIVQEVHNLNDVIRSNRRSEVLNLVGVTREDVVGVQLILIPLESKLSLIVVIQVSSSLDSTALANLGLGSCDVHIRNIMNVNHERITEGSTTITIDHFYDEGVRILIRRLQHLIIEVEEGQVVLSQHTVLIPVVGSIKVGNTVNPCSKVNVRSINTLEADMVNTVDDHDRITFNFDSGRSNRNSFATRHTVVNESLIGVMSHILIHDGELFGETRTINQRHQETILIPNIGQRGVDIIFTRDRIVQICSNHDLSALANILSKVAIIDNKNIVDLRRINHNYAVIARSEALSSCLSNLNIQLSGSRQ